MITHVCVAIHLLGAPAPPDAVQALQQHCDSILGAGECRMTRESSNDDKNGCWRATLVHTVDDGVASVVVGGSGAAAGHVAQREVMFQSKDERTDRWATLGLVIAALVTQEEHAAAASAPPTAATAAPAAVPPPRAGSSWFSRDNSEPTTISEQTEEGHGFMQLADLRLLGVYDSGRLPWATVGGRLGATFGLMRRLDLEIAGAYLTSTGTVQPYPAGDLIQPAIHLDLRSLTLGLCPRSRISPRLSGHACVGGDLGFMTADAGNPGTERHTTWTAYAWVGFDSTFRLTDHLAVVVEYKAEVTQDPVSIRDNSTVIFQSASFSENVALGIAGTF